MVHRNSVKLAEQAWKSFVAGYVCCRGTCVVEPTDVVSGTLVAIIHIQHS